MPNPDSTHQGDTATPTPQPPNPDHPEAPGRRRPERRGRQRRSRLPRRRVSGGPSRSPPCFSPCRASGLSESIGLDLVRQRLCRCYRTSGYTTGLSTVRHRYASRVLIAITRPTGPELVDCQITYIDRAPIEIDRALAQHAAYVAALLDLGVEVVELDRVPDNPDAVLVEDTAVVLDELAVMLHPGAASRVAEVSSVARAASM